MSSKKSIANTEKEITGRERISYVLYFIGQNIFYLLTYMYMNTYFTDIGIPTAMVGVIVLIVKIWDAVNDPIFGGIVDKVQLKKGKFAPWLRIAIPILLIANVALFAVPADISQSGKIAWVIVSYCLWSVGYTMNDIPIFGLITTITGNQNERTAINASGRVAAKIAGMAVAVIIPTFRTIIGGWTQTVLALSVTGAVLMLPIAFVAKERVETVETQKSVGFMEMFRYVLSNKYLLIYYAAFLIVGVLNVESVWGLYIARYCLGNEEIVSITSILSAIPALIIGILTPALCKKIDKFRLFYFATAATMLIGIIRWLVGYESVPAYLLMTVLLAVPRGFSSVLTYMFTPDCAEYGHYKTGKNYPGITFSTQTFFAKLQSALLSATAAVALGFIGFVEGETAVQAGNFAEKLWNTNSIMLLAGVAVGLVILHFYKLNDHDVQLMTKVNRGELSRKEAEEQMINQY